MRFEDIYIRDFGILNNTKLDNLNPNFNIIGGGNRAGKTTLLKLLRYIGYGIPKSDNIPPARNNYDLEAKLDDGNTEYSLVINGYAKPQINDLRNKDREIDNIYSDIDQFTYNQLFTITLEELKKIPTGVSDKEKLQSVLLGAGLKEYTLVPQLKDYFKSNARDIAGKYGKIDVGRLKEYDQIIEEGIQLKKEAKKQVDEYYNLQDEFKSVNKEIKVNEKEIEKAQKKKNRLDLLKSNYEKIQEMIKLEDDLNKEKYSEIKEEKRFYPERADNLYEKYKNLENEFDKLLEDFFELSKKNYSEDIEEKILNYKSKIDGYNNSLSGLEEKHNNIVEKNQELKNKYNELIKDIKQRNIVSTDELDSIMNFETDISYRNTLRNLVKNYEHINEKIEAKNERIEELKRDIISKENKIESIKEDKSIPEPNKIYLYLTLIGLAIITYLTFLNWRFFGLYFVDFVFIYLYYNRYKKRENFIKEVDNIEEDIKENENKKDILKDELNQLVNKQEDITSELDDLKSSLNLDSEISPELLEKYYNDLLNLQKQYLEYKQSLNDLEEKKREHKNELTEIYDFLNNFNEILDIENLDKKVLFDNLEEIVALIKKLSDIKDLLQNIKMERQKLQEIKNEILNLEGMDLIIKEDRELYVIIEDYKEEAKLREDYKGKKERVQEIKNQLKNITEQMRYSFELDSDIGEKKVIDTYLNIFNKYLSLEQVKEEYNKAQEKVSNLSQKIKDLNSKKEEINLRMQNLATEDKIIKAEKTINKARNNLKPLAEKFAINNMSAYILEKYWEKFLEEKKDKLLNKASQIMEKITSGKYNKIEPLETLTDPNFKVHEKNGRVFEQVDHLSRGTREQLFMAIRINRIMEIEPTLPVIIDDSLVNFDPNHLRNIFDIINNLKNRNQIFYLTCHPEQIEFLDEKIDNKNYYSLIKGEFEQVSKNDLIKTLN